MKTHRLEELDIRRAFAAISPEILELLLDVRVVLELAPDCHEVLKWKGISYQRTFPAGAVKDGICQLCPRGDHVELAFVHGAFLPDPQGVLAGGGKHKRSIRIVEVDAVRRSPIRDLIQASVEFRPYDDEA